MDALQRQRYPSEPKELYEPVSYFMSLGGKRLRPVLLLMSADMFGGNVQHSLNAAMAIEVFHNFTLLHDDIMDKAPLRRGNQTVHTKWNESIAILSGDVMLIEAYKLLSSVDAAQLPKVLEIFNETAIGVCEGQQLDMNFENSNEVKISEYLNMIRLKTAVLLGGALKIGAALSNASPIDAEKIYEFGVNLGLAFQLQDDILDVFGDPEKFGKQIGGDILSQKKTFLLIKALELASEEQKNQLLETLSSREMTDADKVNQVTQMYHHLNIKEIAVKAMNEFTAQALSALDQISVERARKSVLQEFVAILQEREQ